MAVLLVVMMFAALLPTSAFAATATSVPLTLNVSSYGAPFISGSTGQHSVSSIRISRYINRTDACSGDDANAQGTATARFVGSNETGWTLVVDIVVGNYSTTETTNARITNKDMSTAGGTISFGMSWNTSGGTSTYLSISGAKDISRVYTLNYNANGGTGAPATQTLTSTASSVTFDISNTVPTHSTLEFKGWATSASGAAAYQPGGKFQTSNVSNTLFAVWGEHVHTDGDDDGYCDDDLTCMHEKDSDGYCIVDGCTHPSSCCPKKPHEHTDEDDDGFCDEDNECMHPKDTEGYCTVEGCTHPETCCPKHQVVPDTYTVRLLIYANDNMATPSSTVVLNNAVEADTDFDLSTINVAGSYSGDPAAAKIDVVGFFDAALFAQYVNSSSITTLTSPLKINSDTDIICVVFDQYAVNYTLDGQPAHTDYIDVRNVQSYTLYNAPEKTGYTFDGWYEKAAPVARNNPGKVTLPLTIKPYNLTGSYNPITYSIVYHGNGGVLSSDANKTQFSVGCTYDEQITLAGDSEFVYDGKTFKGWATSPDAQATYAGGQIGVFNFCSQQDAVYNLYAVWEAESPNPPVEASYKVEHYFEQLDGKYLIDDTATQIIGSTVDSMVSATALDVAFYTVDSTHPDSKTSGKVIANMVSTDGGQQMLVLKLFYKLDRITLSYDADGGVNGPAAQASPINPENGTAQFTVSDVVPTREEYSFKGWQRIDDTKLYKAGDSLVLEADDTLTAVWELNPLVKYTLTYDANGGKDAPAAQSAETRTGSAKMTISTTKPSREDYVFMGWSRYKSGGAEYGAGAAIEITGDTTLYAVWAPNNQAPKTGDDSNIGLWAALAGLSMISAGAALVIFRKKSLGK